MKAAIIQVFGRVQGVGFRYYTEKKAHELGLAGFVENKPDGSVYIEAEGEEADLDAFVVWCRRGPQWAHVTDIRIAPVPPLGLDGFHIR